MDTLKSNQLNSSLAEYQQLRSEVRQLQESQLKLYSLLITTITAAIGATLTTKAFDIFLVLPIIAIGFAFRYLWHNNILIMLSDYLEVMDKNIFRPILGVANEGDTETSWIGWQSYFSENYKMMPFHKFANQTMFVLIPFLPSIIYCIWAIIAEFHLNSSSNLNNVLPKEIYITYLALFIPGGIYISLKLWQAE